MSAVGTELPIPNVRSSVANRGKADKICSLRILDPTETLAAKFAVMHDAINSASRPSSEWNDDDYDVLADGVVGGRIFKAKASPVGTPWMWTLGFGDHEDRNANARL
jgi:hypothetical protein